MDASKCAKAPEDAKTGLDTKPKESPEIWKAIWPDEPTELVIGLVGPLGTDWQKIRRLLSDRLSTYGYAVHVIWISRDLIPELSGKPIAGTKYEKARDLIDRGNELRESTHNNAILALAAMSKIKDLRKDPGKNAFIISSLKHPEEIAALRTVYAQGFYLFGVHTSESRRLHLLMEVGEQMAEDEARSLIKRDDHEPARHGQHTRDAFHLADFFLDEDGNDDKIRFGIWRCLDLVFGRPTITPTFNEFAMFMAFASSFRSADLSRQVGAVIARREEILATGANDCPRAGGGLYWPVFDSEESRLREVPMGRDSEIGFDNNHKERERIILEIAHAAAKSDDVAFVEQLRRGSVGDITEYGRSVHAEMESICACARIGVSCQGATMYVTTFPCHNCAKHIIASGIGKVIYVEPYPKSKAADFHPDAITFARDSESHRIRFQPFIGVGPRRFLDLFSMHLSSGRELVRKDGQGRVVKWREKDALPRMQLVPVAYLRLEGASHEYMQRLAASRKG